MEEIKYPPKLEKSNLEICTEDYFFPNRIFSTTKPILFHDYSVGMHLHDFYEINIVLEGKGAHYVENKIYEIKGGDVFVIPPYLSHGYYNLGNLQVFHILVSIKFLNRVQAELGCLDGFIPLFSVQPLMRINTSHSFFLQLSYFDMQELKPLLYEYLKASNNDSINSATENDLILGSFCFNILIQLCKYYKQNELHINKISGYIKKYKLFAESLQFIYAHYNEKITVYEISKHINMSYSAYDRLFKEILGISPIQFIIQYRLSRAKYLLEYSSLTIIEIAMQTGFYDSAHFNKQFLKQEGVRPSIYREKFIQSGRK